MLIGIFEYMIIVSPVNFALGLAGKIKKFQGKPYKY